MMAVLAAGAAACGGSAGGDGAVADVDPELLAAYGPLPTAMMSESNAMTAEKVALGRMLYYDTRFSVSGDISCYVCHPLHDYGTSHRSTGVGHDGHVGARNEPTVYNAAGHIAQFWDGRAADVETQALGPVLNPVEMGMPTEPEVVAVLKSIPGYVRAFEASFPGEPEPVTFRNFGQAIGAFERGLVTPSRWDAFLAGDAAALEPTEMAGFEAFVDAGCGACHAGVYVGGASYQKAGLVHAWYDQSDPGRVQVTGQEPDRMMFKVPSLRNVEETWPYFHDGSVQRLSDAVRIMGWHQLGANLSEDDVAAITTWLRTLTGPVDFDYVNEPTLPAAPAPAMPAEVAAR